jgi:L-amino acid N-acyltransferase YncA
MSASFTIEPMTPSNWPAVVSIYEQGMTTGNATFETVAPSWEAWNAAHRPDCRLVARDTSGQVIGWAALSPISKRAVYAGVCEESIYIAPEARGKGIGKALLAAVIDASEQAGIWTLQTGIFPENKASIALHESCGFRVLGIRERIGQRDGIWRDVVFMERRSKIVGQ